MPTAIREGGAKPKPTPTPTPTPPTIAPLTEAQQQKIAEATFTENQKWLATEEGTRAVERYQEPYVAKAQANKPKPQYSVTYSEGGVKSTVTFDTEEKANRFSESLRSTPSTKPKGIPGPGMGPAPGSFGEGVSKYLTEKYQAYEDTWANVSNQIRSFSSSALDEASKASLGGDKVGAFIGITKAGVSRLGVGAYEGVSFMARPTQWGKTVSAGVDLVKQIPGAIANPRGVVDTVKALATSDPLLGLEVIGGFVGGYATDKFLFGKGRKIQAPDEASSLYKTRGRGAPDFPEPPSGFPEAPPPDFPEPPPLDTRKGRPNFPEPPTDVDVPPIDFPEPPLLDTRKGALDFPEPPTTRDPYPLDFPEPPSTATRKGPLDFPEPPTGAPDVPPGDFPEPPLADTRSGAPNFPDAYSGSPVDNTPTFATEPLAKETFGDMTFQQKVDYYKRMGLTQTNAELSAKYADPLRSPMVQGMVDVMPDQTALIQAIEADVGVMPRALGLGVTQDLGIGQTSSIGTTVNLYKNTVQGFEGPSVQEIQAINSQAQGYVSTPEMAEKQDTTPIIAPLPTVNTPVDTSSATDTTITTNQGQGEATTPDQGQGEAITPDQGQGEGTTPDQGQGEGTTPDQGQDQDTRQDQKQRQKMKDKDRYTQQNRPKDKLRAPDQLQYLVKFRYVKKSETLRVYAKSFYNALSKALEGRSTQKVPIETVITIVK